MFIILWISLVFAKWIVLIFFLLYSPSKLNDSADISISNSCFTLFIKVSEYNLCRKIFEPIVRKMLKFLSTVYERYLNNIASICLFAKLCHNLIISNSDLFMSSNRVKLRLNLFGGTLVITCHLDLPRYVFKIRFSYFLSAPYHVFKPVISDLLRLICR